MLFQREDDAQRFAAVLPHRLAKVGLAVAPEKTPLILLGVRDGRPGPGASGTFDFLGFCHRWATHRTGRAGLVRTPARRTLQGWLREHRHDPPRVQQHALIAKLRGFYQSFAIRVSRLSRVRRQILVYWQRTLLPARSARPETVGRAAPATMVPAADAAGRASGGAMARNRGAGCVKGARPVLRGVRAQGGHAGSAQALARKGHLPWCKGYRAEARIYLPTADRMIRL